MEPRRLSPGSGGPAGVDVLAVLSDGDTCVVAGGGLYTVSLSTGEYQRRRDKIGPVSTFALAGDDRLVIAHSSLRVLDTTDFTVVSRLDRLDKVITGMAAVGDTLITGTWSGAGVWDLSTGRCRLDLIDAGEVISVALSADARHAVTLTHDGAVRTWELANGTPVRTLRGADPRIEPIDWAAPTDWDHDEPLSALARSTLHVDKRTEWVTVAYHGIAAGLITGRLGPLGPTAGRTMAVRASDGVLAVAAAEQVRIFAADGTPMGVLGPAYCPVQALAFTPDGRLVCGLTTGDLEVWPAEGTRPCSAADLGHSRRPGRVRDRPSG